MTAGGTPGRNTAATPFSALRVPALAWLLLLAAALLAPAHALWQEPHLKGTDAYYYAVQADSWHATGKVRIPDGSVLHPLAGTLMRAGLGAEKAVTAVTVTALLLFCTAFYALCASRRCGLRAPFPARLLLLWPLASPSLLFCAVEFPKTFSFLPPFALALALAGPRLLPGRALAALALLAVACLLHKMGLVYLAACCAGALCLYLPLPRGAAGPLPAKKRAALTAALPWLAAAGAVVAGAALLSALLLPDAARLADLLRLKGSRLTPGVIALLLEPNLPVAIRAELVLALAALALMLLYRPGANELGASWPGARAKLFVLCLALPSFLPALGDEPFGFGERFGLLLPVMTALAGACLAPSGTGGAADAGAGRAKAASKDAGQDKDKTECTGAAGCGVASGTARASAALPLAWAGLVLLVLALSPFRLDWAYPARLNPPYAEYERVSEMLRPLDIPMLVAHRGIHYYYKFRTGRDAFSYEPEAHWPENRVWRLVYGVTATELHAHLPPECGWASGLAEHFPGTPYSLLREDCYRSFRGAVRQPHNPELHALLWESPMNPSEPRPAFLYAKHADEEDGEFSALPRPAP